MKRTIIFGWGRGGEKKTSQLEVEAEHFEAVMTAIDHIQAERPWELMDVMPDDKPNIYVGQRWKGIPGMIVLNGTAIVTACSEGEVWYDWTTPDMQKTEKGSLPVDEFLTHWEPDIYVCVGQRWRNKKDKETIAVVTEVSALYVRYECSFSGGLGDGMCKMDYFIEHWEPV